MKWSILLLSVGLLVGPLSGAAPRADSPAGAAAKEPRFDPVEHYVKRRIEGFEVLVNKRLLAREHQDLCDQTLKVLGEHLFRITRVVPAEALSRLRKIPIWVELAHPRHPCMCYHPSADWLQQHDMNPQKAGAVEIANARNFLDWTIAQPWMVLHELAHGYHHQVLGFENAEVRAAFDRAVASKVYESVLHISGQKRRHYALTNDKEYFAEATEAYFGTNDFFPFVRAELRQFDPGGFALMEKLWGVEKGGGK
jgi:hypothetical protein